MSFSFHVLVYFIDKKSYIKVWKLLLFIIVFGKLFRGFFRSKTKLHVHNCHPVWKIYFIWYNTMYCSLFFCKWHVHVSLIMSIFTARRFYFKYSSYCFKWIEPIYSYTYSMYMKVCINPPCAIDGMILILMMDVYCFISQKVMWMNIKMLADINNCKSFFRCFCFIILSFHCPVYYTKAALTFIINLK